MEQLPSKTQIGEIECAGCGDPVPLKVNINQCVYAYCTRVLERDEAGKVTEKCMTRFQMGRSGSQKIIKDYLKTKGIENHVEHTETRKEQLGDSESQRTEPNGEGENGCGAERESGDHSAPAPSGYERAKNRPDTAKGNNNHGQSQPKGFGAGIKHFLTGDE